MVISRGKAPTAQETFLQMAQAAGLRGRVLVTLGLLILVRLGIYIPIPGIDRFAFNERLQSSNLGGVIGFLDIFSGGGLSALGIFASLVQQVCFLIFYLRRHYSTEQQTFQLQGCIRQRVAESDHCQICYRLPASFPI